MLTLWSRIHKQLFVIIAICFVAIVVFELWLCEVTESTLLENGENYSDSQHGCDINGVAYISFKPDVCSSRKKPPCLGYNSHNVNSKNRSRDIDEHCFPKEVVIKDIGLDDPNFPPKDKILPMEKETMSDSEYFEMFNTVSFEKSQIFLEDPNQRHQVGDIIRVRVDLVNKSGKPRTSGGDDVRALMMSQDKAFRISGDVIDLKNGSYQVKFQALQEGNNMVVITIPYTREMRATMFKWLRRYKTLLYYFGVFKWNDIQEFTVCSPFSTIPVFIEVCNLTDMNDGMPWFCGRPVTPELHCDTIVKVVRLDYADIKANYAQYSDFFTGNLERHIKRNVRLFILKGKQSKQSHKINCNRIKPRDTWNTTIPTGYVYKQQWKQQICNNTITNTTAVLCLVNTTLFITGDSTTHQWYTFMTNLTNCTLGRLKWAHAEWRDNSICINHKYNITIRWAPHVLPFVRARKLPDGKMNLKSVSTHLKQLPFSGRIIFLIHLYAHFTRQHYSLFWMHIRSLKPAIRDSLKRNKDLKIAIKSPHMFYRSPCLPILNDLQAPIFIDIIQKEFDEFKDSVIYLNYWEINHAFQNNVIHPEWPLVWKNIKHLLSFVC